MPAGGSGCFDADWIVIGSGFGGSVSALRLAERGHRVVVLESGRRFSDEELPRSSWALRKYVWSPRLGLRGILRTTVLRDVAIVSGAGVGGGSLVYASTLYRPKRSFYASPSWSALGDWEAELAPHFDRAERMLGVATYDEDDDGARLLREVGARMGVADTYARTPVGVFLGPAGETVPDPYFGGAGPDRTGCVRCAECHLGCRIGAKNTLEKNYLWFAERHGADIRPGRQAVDVRPLEGAPDGAEGYAVTVQRPGAWVRRDRETLTARGVVLAAGALGTNELLARARERGSLARLSPALGRGVRTNSEALYAVTLPRDHAADLTRRAVITASIHPAADTHVEYDTFGRSGDAMALLYGPLVGAGTRLHRAREVVTQAVRHPVRTLATRWPVGWSRRTLVVLVMQDVDTAISFALERLPFGLRRLQTRTDPERPIAKHLPQGHRAVELTAELTGGVAQSALSDVLLDRPATAHILGGAVIGATANEGVVDRDLRVHGYRNLLVCDGSVVPANPGVNPSLTITALAEHAMASMPGADTADAGGRDTTEAMALINGEDGP